MENGLLYVLAFSAMAIALLACVLPQASNLEIPNGDYTYQIYVDGSEYVAENNIGTEVYRSTNASQVRQQCYDALPSSGGKIVVIGNVTYDTPITMLKNFTTYEHQTGKETLTNHGYIIGDANNFIQGFSIRISHMDGVNRTFIGIWGRNGWRGDVRGNLFSGFDKAINIDPVGTGFGENYFYIDSISNNNYGIDHNATASGTWGQGNVFFASIYGSYTCGARVTATAGGIYEMEEFHLTTDNAVGIDPMFPSAGGGYDLNDTAGVCFWYLKYYRSESTVVRHYASLYISNNGVFINFPVYKSVQSLTIGLSDSYGAYRTYANIMMPTIHMQIVVGGSFASGENVTVAFQSYNGGASTLYKSFTATGTLDVTSTDLYSILVNGKAVGGVYAWAKTTNSSTSVTVNVGIYG